MKNLRKIYIGANLLILAGLSVATAQAQEKLPSGYVAKVNEEYISQALFDKNLEINLQQGRKDSPELRQAIKDELINLKLFAQEAVKQGIDKTPDAKLQLEQQRLTGLTELFLADYLKKINITDDDLKAEYNRQVNSLGDVKSLQEYNLAHILLSTEDEAKAVINRLKKEPFEKVAFEKSIDATNKAKGGDMGWVLSNQILPAISTVVRNVPKGSVAPFPVQTSNGWHVFRVNDKRPYKLPSFEDSKNNLRIAILQQKRNEFLTQLRQSSKIVQ